MPLVPIVNPPGVRTVQTRPTQAMASAGNHPKEWLAGVARGGEPSILDTDFLPSNPPAKQPSMETQPSRSHLPHVSSW